VSLSPLVRDAGIVALAAAGALNLFWMARRRRSPAETRGCLLAAGALLLFAAALWLQSRGLAAPSLAAALVGAAAALGWFHHIYRQSLQNTTM
jgi:peptidoglycan/LPS O-acetylase OafA/YrhL